MPAGTRDDLVEIYCTSDQFEADVIRDQVFAPNQVEAVILDRTSHPFNTPTMSGAYFIAVPQRQSERARSLLEEARRGRVISDTGQFVGSQGRG